MINLTPLEFQRLKYEDARKWMDILAVIAGIFVFIGFSAGYKLGSWIPTFLVHTSVCQVYVSGY